MWMDLFGSFWELTKVSHFSQWGRFIDCHLSIFPLRFNSLQSLTVDQTPDGGKNKTPGAILSNVTTAISRTNDGFMLSNIKAMSRRDYFSLFFFFLTCSRSEVRQLWSIKFWICFQEQTVADMPSGHPKGGTSDKSQSLVLPTLLCCHSHPAVYLSALAYFLIYNTNCPPCSSFGLSFC